MSDLLVISDSLAPETQHQSQEKEKLIRRKTHTCIHTGTNIYLDTVADVKCVSECKL